MALSDLIASAAKGNRQALTLLQGFADSGDAEAMFHLARLYDVPEGKVVPTDLSAAKCLYEKAAHLGHLHSQFALANMYDYGDGVEKNCVKARKWYEVAAKQNFGEAQMHYARMLQSGRGGYCSIKEAAQWYARAVESGHKLAATNLGLLHLHGDLEDSSDTEAFRLFEFAAERLDGLAHLLLGEMYSSGRGAERDGGYALFHFCVAVLLLPEGENREKVTKYKESILAQVPDKKLFFEEKASTFIAERGGYAIL